MKVTTGTLYQKLPVARESSRSKYNRPPASYQNKNKINGKQSREYLKQNREKASNRASAKILTKAESGLLENLKSVLLT